MSGLLWVKMPSKWISDSVLFTEFSSLNSISTDIAALKIYICLCLNSKVVKGSNQIDSFKSCMTYDELMETASLSRLLISRGLAKLSKSNLILREGTTRKKIYSLVASKRGGWCKMPRKDLLVNGNSVSAFTNFTQRYPHERDALKLFLYLLSIRTNTKRFVDVSRGLINYKTGVKLEHIDGSIGFLRSIGLLDKVESKGYLKVTNYKTNVEVDKLHRYWVTGNRTLNMRSVLVNHDGKPEHY